MTNPLVSVIIPAYNADRFIDRAIGSVKAQSLADWELIIVNDGSTDQTPSVIEAAKGEDIRIQCIHQENLGLSHARNAGLRVSKGEYIQFLDADDKLLPRKLEVSLSRFQLEPSLDIVASQARVIDSKNSQDKIVPLPNNNKMEQLWEKNFLVVNAPLVRKELITRVGFFETEDTQLYQLYGCEDWQFWLRASLIGARLEFVAEVLVENYRHEENMSRKDIEMHLSEIWCLNSLQTKCRDATPNTEELRVASYLYRVCRGLAILRGHKYETMLAQFQADPLIQEQSTLRSLLRLQRALPEWVFRKLCHTISKGYFFKLRRLIASVSPTKTRANNR